MVLSTGVVNRVAIAGQLLEVMQASGPTGTYSIEADTDAGSLVPQKDEDWEFTIVVEVGVVETVRITPRRLTLPPLAKDSDDE